MFLKARIPNFITLLNLFSGCIAAVYAFDAQFEMAFYFVSLGIFLDFFDGFLARIWGVSSALGVQLDSLADMVTSGFVPGLVMFKMLENTLPGYELPAALPYLGFVITMGSCYRLAKFNIDTRQTDSFIGLPTPANALFVLSLPLVLAQSDSMLMLQLLTNPYVLLVITGLSAFILNAELPLFALKIKKFRWADNKLQFSFLLFSAALLTWLGVLGVPLIIISYVLVSVIVRKKA